MATIEEYLAKEAEFMARTDALCEDTTVPECDCCKCPCREECNWLYDNLPEELRVHGRA